jgi:Flp pilus assembly protein TadD
MQHLIGRIVRERLQGAEIDLLLLRLSPPERALVHEALDALWGSWGQVPFRRSSQSAVKRAARA